MRPVDTIAFVPPLTPWQTRRPSRRHVVVCGANPLAHRLVEELTTQYGEQVTVIVRSKKRDHAPQIAALDGVRVVEASLLDDEAFRAARLGQARSLALVEQDDVGNLHAALRAQEINPDLRLVVRMFNANLRDHVHKLFRDCAALSDAAIAAPAFVAAVLGEVTASHVRLPRRTLAVAVRRQVAAEDVVCPLATAADRPQDARLLADEAGPDDLVLAAADGYREPLLAYRPRWYTVVFNALRATVGRRLWLVVAVLLLLMAVGVVLRMVLGYDPQFGDALYVTVMTIAGAGDPNIGQPAFEKVIQAVTMVAAIALVPAITAALVDSVVRARLALASGRLRRKLSGHVIVTGLGNVGGRVIRQMADLRIPVVGIEADERVPAVTSLRRRGIPVIIGDATREETLAAAQVQTCRALVTVTSSDVVNLETALNARARRPRLRVVLRVFDGDFAERVEKQFGIPISRSVSYLAASAFAAAVVERQVIGTIPVGRQVLLIADIPIAARAELAGATVGEANEAGQSRIIAVYRADSSEPWWWGPPAEHRLVPGERAVVLATKPGLGHMLARSVPADRNDRAS